MWNQGTITISQFRRSRGIIVTFSIIVSRQALTKEKTEDEPEALLDTITSSNDGVWKCGDLEGRLSIDYGKPVLIVLSYTIISLSWNV